MPHAYTEDQLVEQPAKAAGPPSPWSSPSGRGSKTLFLERETKGEVVFVSRLRAALEPLNPALPPEGITAAVDELTRERSAMSLEAANAKKPK